MASERSLLVYTVIGEKCIEIPLRADTTAEDVCILVAKELKISPVARLLFALKIRDKDIFFHPGFKFSQLKTNSCDFRLRFKVPVLRNLQKLDINAYTYYFHQARHDVMKSKIPDLDYNKCKGELIGLSVADMYRHMIEGNAPRENVLSEYKRFVPSAVLRKHGFFLKAPIYKSLTEIEQASQLDAMGVKECYLKQFHQLFPAYLSEDYQALKLTGSDPTTVFIRVNPFHEETPGILIREDSRKDWAQLCSIEDIYTIAVGDAGTVEISRHDGIPVNLHFRSTPLMVSFISLIDGYYRLGVHWTFTVSRDLTPPSFLKLKQMRCHGPVGAKFAAEKFKKKSATNQYQRGCYILRQSETHYDTFLLDVCCADGAPPEIFTIEPKVQDGVEGFMLAADGLWYKSVSALIASRKAEGSRPWLKECLPPSEYDQPENLLLCKSPAKLEEGTDPVKSNRGSHDLINKASLIYEKELPGKNNGLCSLFVAQWVFKKPRRRKTQVLKVAVRRLHANYDPEFVLMATNWGQLRTETNVHLLGISFEPTALVFELLPMGPLNKYLQEHRIIVKEADLAEAAKCLASAFYYLEEHNIVHGNIRCRKVLVCSHDDSSMQVKLADPGLPTYTSHDIHWLPLEYHDNPDGARTSLSADIWAFGTTLWEIFAYGRELPDPGDLDAVKKYYATGGRLPCPPKCPNDILEVMKGCWQAEPELRKQPQGLMRDLNQIFYQGFCSRRQHTYTAAYPKRMIKAAEEDLASISNSESMLSELTVGSFVDSTIPSENSSLYIPSSQDAWLLGESQEPLLSQDQVKMMISRADTSGTSEGLEMAFELDEECTVVLQGRIGQGFYGEVYRGTLERNDGESELVAVKKLKMDALGDALQNYQDFEREISIMKKLKHPNIVRLRGIVHEPEVRLVMEFVPHGSLQCYLRSARTEKLTDLDLLKFALDVATGMKYLGEQNIVHRDLATRNILVADRNLVKISDFGLAQVMGQSNYYVIRTNRDLPIRWYALESLQEGRFSARSDVWSFGVVVWEMFTSGAEPQLPGCGDSNSSLLPMLQRGTRLPRPAGCPESVYSNLMAPCWHATSARRPTFEELITRIQDLTDALL